MINKPYVGYFYNNLPECTLYILDNIPKGSNIAVNNLTNDGLEYTRNDVIYQLLYDYNLFFYNCNKNLTYSDFYDFCIKNNITYALIKRSFLNEQFLNIMDDKNNFNQVFITYGNYNPNKPIYNSYYRIYKFNSKQNLKDYFGTYSFTNDYNNEIGQYKGSISFENEVGKKGTDIRGISYCTNKDNTEVIESWKSHKEVLKQSNKLGKSDYFRMDFWQNFHNGTIEFWMGIENQTKEVDIDLADGLDNIISLKIIDGYMYFWNGNWSNLKFIEFEKWYHLKIKFRSNNYSLFIDGYPILNESAFLNPMSSGIDRFKYIVRNGTSYFDAFGECWNIFSNDYEEGDNTNKYGDITQFINTYQVFNGSYIKINSGIYGHSKILECYNKFWISSEFSKKQLNGSIELYYLIENVKIPTEIFLMQNSTKTIRIEIVNNYFQWYNNSKWIKLCKIYNDTWYHLRIDFKFNKNYTSKKYDSNSLSLSLNNVIFGPFNFTSQNLGLNKLGFESKYNNKDRFYLDAIGYSWDPFYDVGDNLID
ncbi:MAG: hypothetical protein P8Y97_16470 [Candidatus Lokiarchaeota archaeon]